MIFTDRTVIVQKGTSSINDSIILYRGDKEVQIRFTLNEGSPFRFGSGASPNIIEKTEATYGQLIIKRPNDLPAVFSEVVPTNEGKIIFTITAEMIDEITEVGNYTFQIRLFDESRNSRATLPEVVDGIEIREPIAAEDVSTTNEVGVATVGYALTTAGTQEDAFDSQGNYNKTAWATGDRITAAKLNKIEAGIDGVNKKVANGGTGGGSNINDTTASATTTYSSNKIESIKENLSSQIKDIANKVDNIKSSSLINQNGGGVLKIWVGTKVEYDALLVKDEDTVYLVEGSGGDSTVTYTITNNLTNCTNSNSASTIAANNSYTATITANTDYTLDTVTVSMGGNDVTSTVYSNGSIFIDSVIGDIIITASATQNTIGGGDEPVTGYDLSNANYSVTEYLNTTGTLTRGGESLHPLTIIDYIEVPVGTTITMEDPSSSISNIYIAAYDSSKTFIQRSKSDNQSTSYSYTFGNTTKYIRITIAALSTAYAATMLENIIVKINGNLVTFPTVTIP